MLLTPIPGRSSSPSALLSPSLSGVVRSSAPSPPSPSSSALCIDALPDDQNPLRPILLKQEQAIKHLEARLAFMEQRRVAIAKDLNAAHEVLQMGRITGRMISQLEMQMTGVEATLALAMPKAEAQAQQFQMKAEQLQWILNVDPQMVAERGHYEELVRLQGKFETVKSRIMSKDRAFLDANGLQSKEAPSDAVKDLTLRLEFKTNAHDEASRNRDGSASSSGGDRWGEDDDVAMQFRLEL